MSVSVDVIITINEISAADHKNMGYAPKTLNGEPLSFMCQLETLLASIRRNWTFPRNVYVFHSLPLSMSAIHMLARHDAEPVSLCVDDPGWRLVENRVTALSPKAPIKSDFRLILDADMLALSEPVFDFGKDAECGLAGYNFLAPLQWQYVCNCLDIMMPSGRHVEMPGSPWRIYATESSVGFFPVFNAGATLIRNEFAESIYHRVIDIMRILRNLDLPPFVRGQYGYTMANSLAIVSSGSWSLFSPGFNFLATMLNVEQFGGEISLYHYLGKEKRDLSEKFGTYFKE